MTATTSQQLVSLEDIQRAQDILRPVAVRTPLLPLEGINMPDGVRLLLKPEMLQRGGAFKFRGAYNFLSALSPADRARGVIAPSSGNHAQAVALAARLYGVPATVVMPETVTPAKRAGAERLGARIELAGRTTKDRYDRAEEIAAAEGCIMVPPYDDLLIIAGQGTAGAEIVEDLDEIDTVVVPVGGGGLSAGVGAAIKRMKPAVRVVGVEPAGAPKLSRAREAGKPVTLDHTDSLADGLMAVRIGTITFEHHQEFLDEVVTVPDDELAPAMRVLLDRAKLVAEPSGAITLAAVLTGAFKVRAGNTVCVLSGGNIEWDGLTSLLAGSGNASV
jgi:threonine dehydratase